MSARDLTSQTGSLVATMHLVPIASGQSLPHEGLARPGRAVEGGAVIRIGGVDVVDAVVYRIVQHLGGQRHVDVVVAPVYYGQTHAAEAKDRDTLARTAERTVEHAHCPCPPLVPRVVLIMASQ